MILVPKLPGKAQYLSNFSFPLVRQLCEKTASENFVGGRPCYDKEVLFVWLLVKKVLHWGYECQKRYRVCVDSPGGTALL